MTAKMNWVTAGLVFLGYRNIDIATATSRAAAALEALDERITSIRAISDEHAVVTGQHHRVRLVLREDVRVPTLRTPADVVLDVSVKKLTGDEKATFEPDAVLARVTKRLHTTFSPDHIQWIDEAAVISSADFLLATSQDQSNLRTRPLRPEQVRRRPAPLPAIDATHDVLQRRFITEAKAATAAATVAKAIPRFGGIEWTLDGIITDMPDQAGPPIEDIRDDRDSFRLSAWLLSIGVACIALPVGVALIVINLVKGENLRLASQTAALTGTFVTFNLHGATADTLTLVQGVLG